MDTHGHRVDRVDSGRQRSTAVVPVDSREVDSGSTAVDSVVDRVDRVDRVDSQGSEVFAGACGGGVFLAHMRIAQLSARVWFDYVPSASNVADLPTRLDDAAAARLNTIASVGLCPCAFRPSGPSRARGLS